MSEPRTREVYAVWHFQHGYVTDTCAGGDYSGEEVDALTWPTPGEAQEAMKAAEIGELGKDYEIVPITEPWAKL